MLPSIWVCLDATAPEDHLGPMSSLGLIRYVYCLAVLSQICSLPHEGLGRSELDPRLHGPDDLGVSIDDRRSSGNGHVLDGYGSFVGSTTPQ